MQKTVTFSLMCATAVAIFGLAYASVSAAGPNLVLNGNFEQASSVASVPLGWNKSSSAGTTRTWSYPVVGNGGGKAAKVQIFKLTSGNAKWFFNRIAVTPGTVYTYSDNYLSNASTKVTVEFKLNTGAYKYIQIGDSTSSGSTWKQFSAQVTAPAGAVSMTAARILANVGSLTIDNVSVTAPDAPPPPPPPPPTTGFSEGMVTISFDDSWTSQYTTALPIIENAGIKATFFLTTEPIAGGWLSFITPAQANDYRVRGHEIAGHTVTHANLTTLTGAALTAELVDSKNYLQSITGTSVITFAYPYGAVTDTVKTAVKNAGYVAARGIDQSALNLHTTDKFELRAIIPEFNTPTTQIKTAIDTAKANKQWLILGFHEIDNSGGQYTNTPAQLQEIINYIKSNNVKTVTVKEGAALMAP